MIQTSYEYRGFLYTKDDDKPYLVLFDGKPMIEFDEYELLTNFVDNVTNMVEQIPWFNDLKLHLTGCKRCARSANSEKFDPCETGKPKFINARNIIAHVCGTMVDAIMETRKVQEPPLGE